MGLRSVICRIYSFVAGSFRKPRSHADLGRFTLPTEIISMIGTHLDMPSLICLALTCRTLYGTLFPSCTELDRPQRERFLLLLEKSTPHLYFCHACTTLHTWRSSWFRDLQDYSYRPYRAPCQLGNAFEISIYWFTERIPYHLARVVMNAHFYGDTHGVAVDELSCNLPLSELKDGIKRSCSWLARIIHGNLIVCTHYTVFHTGGNARTLRRFFNDEGPNVCAHLRTTSRPQRDSSKDDSTWYESNCMFPELAENSTRPEYFASCTASVNSCPRCMTDYCMDIAKEGSGWVVKVTVYQQLGRARSPRDWDWDVMMDYMSPQNPGRLHEEHPPGIVRHRWSQADAITLAPEGEFLQP